MDSSLATIAAEAGLNSPGNSRGLTGHLDLVCALDSRGMPVLRRQSFRAPIHLSKPHHDAGVLVLNVVNPTAGLLEGDRIDFDVAVERGAGLLLTTPSASRAHRMRGAGVAEVSQRLSVKSGGFLEFWPELFIPQAGTRYLQRTRIDVEETAELLFFESLAPGRVASGEAFEFTELRWVTDVFAAGRQVVREHYRLRPGEEAVAGVRAIFPEAYYASGFVVSPRLGPQHPCWQAIHDLHSAEAWVGCGPLVSGGAVIKCLAAGSVPLRALLSAIREQLYAALERPIPSLRRA